MNDLAGGPTRGVPWLAVEFDLAAVDAFQAAVDAALDAKRELVLDLSELSFLDSTGIRAILAVAGRSAAGSSSAAQSHRPEGSSTSSVSRGTKASASRIDGRPGWREKRREP